MGAGLAEVDAGDSKVSGNDTQILKASKEYFVNTTQPLYLYIP